MRKKFFLLVCCCLLFVLPILFCGIRQESAFAASDVDVMDIRFVFIDVTVTHENKETAETDDDEINAVYGDTVTLKARLDDADPNNNASVYNNVIMEFNWYFLPKDAKAGDTPTALNDRLISTNVVELTLTDCVPHSGDYYLLVTALKFNGKERRLASPMKSDVVTVTIAPKPLTVEYGENSVVYNGKTQNISYTVKGEVEGKKCETFIDQDIIPSDCGVYTVNGIGTNNTNYVFNENNSTTFTITKKILLVQLNDITVLAGTAYQQDLIVSYDGFCPGENEKTVFGDNLPTVPDEYCGYIVPGTYTIKASGITSHKNYDIRYSTATVQLNVSKISEENLIGFSGSASGSFAYDTKLEISDADKSAVASSFKPWEIPAKIMRIRLTGDINSDTYTVIMKDIDLTDFFMQVYFVNNDGTTEKIDSYTYRKASDDKPSSFTMKLNKTSGYIVVYHNLLWLIIPATVLLIIAVTLIIFHVRDKRKNKLNRLIYGSAKVEADKYRELVAGYVDEENRKV